MPYIRQSARDSIDYYGLKPETPGELNYIITRLVHDYIRLHSPGEDIYYAVLNDAIGVLECAKLELYRRRVAPYEDQKCAQNGDVYDG